MARTKKIPSKASVNTAAPEKNIDNLDMKELIKVNFERAIQTQRLSYVEGIAAGAGDNPHGAPSAENEAEAVPAVIDSDSWLDTQHVEGTLQSLVAQSAKLRNTVGVFPVFSIETMERLAQDAAEEKVIRDLGLPTRRTPAGDLVLIERPLPSPEGLNKRQLAARAKENKKRNQEAQDRREKATALLAENDMTTNELFQLFLEAMANSEQAFLGNPNNPNIRFEDCTQFIIPIRKDANHYTTAVVHLCDDEGTWIANIKYYDSMGAEMDDNLQAQLIAFFTSCGYEPRYECVSESDQKEGHNCSIFASFKSIDIANENIGEDERLLDKLTKDNYEQRMNYYRYIVSLKLKDMGQNVSPSKELTEDIKQQQKDFANLSKHTQKVTMLNRLLVDFITRNEDIIKKVEAKRSQKTVKPANDAKSKPLSDLDPKVLFASCDALCKKMNDLLKEKSQKQRKSVKDKKDIKLLLGAISAFKAVREDIKLDLAKVTGHKPEATKLSSSTSSSKVNKSWFQNIGWKMALGIGALGSAILFFGYPYLLPVMIKLSAVFPTNPIFTILLGAGSFALGLQGVNWLASVTNAEKKKASNSNQTVTSDSIADDADLEDDDEDDVEELDQELDDKPVETVVKKEKDADNVEKNSPTILPNFNKSRSQESRKSLSSAASKVVSDNSASSEKSANSDDIIVVTAGSSSRAKKKLSFGS